MKAESWENCAELFGVCEQNKSRRQRSVWGRNKGRFKSNFAFAKPLRNRSPTSSRLNQPTEQSGDSGYKSNPKECLCSHCPTRCDGMHGCCEENCRGSMDSP